MFREGAVMAFREQQPTNRRAPLRPVERQVEIDVERARRTAPERRNIYETGAMTIGVLSLIAGIAGFLSPFVTGGGPGLINTGPGLLFNLFGINGMHAFAHLLIGILGIAMARQASSAKTFLWIVGVVFALLAIAGFATNQPGIYNLLGMTVNHADHWLHTILALIGFGFLAAGSRDQDRRPVT
jgi:hypothetical protein